MTEWARDLIHRHKLGKALDGDTEDHVQSRAALAATAAALDEFKEKREALEQGGDYTATGLRKALHKDGTATLRRLEELNNAYLQPRIERLEGEIAGLPRSKPAEVSEGERARLIDAYTRANSGERTRLLAAAISGRSPKLAAALIAEDELVTGLLPSTKAAIANAVQVDEQPQRREELQRQLAAVNTASEELQMARISVETFFEEIDDET